MQERAGREAGSGPAEAGAGSSTSSANKSLWQRLQDAWWAVDEFLADLIGLNNHRCGPSTHACSPLASVARRK